MLLLDSFVSCPGHDMQKHSLSPLSLVRFLDDINRISQGISGYPDTPHFQKKFLDMPETLTPFFDDTLIYKVREFTLKHMCNIYSCF